MLIAFTRCSIGRSSERSLIVKHYAGGPGTTIIYLIKKDGLQIETNCDLANFKEATVYKRIFSEVESDSIISSIKSLQLDTLKSLYKYQGYFNDGFFTEVELKNGWSSSRRITFDNIYTPTAEKLNALIDNLVIKPEFRLATWGRPNNERTTWTVLKNK